MHFINVIELLINTFAVNENTCFYLLKLLAHWTLTLFICLYLWVSNETLEYFDREAKKRRDQETNLWNEPGDTSHSERDDDRMLYNLLQCRAKTRRGSQVHTRTIHFAFCHLSRERMMVLFLSQGYRRLSIDIEAVREVRREVRDNWKMILENLGKNSVNAPLFKIPG